MGSGRQRASYRMTAPFNSAFILGPVRSWSGGTLLQYHPLARHNALHFKPAISYPEGAHSMSEANVVANQKRILANQASIIANQKQIKANQETIKKNQGAILKNQATLNTIVDNQKKILSKLK
jgi:hypothetical protein